MIHEQSRVNGFKFQILGVEPFSHFISKQLRKPFQETLPGRIVLLLLEGEEDLAAWTKVL